MEETENQTAAPRDPEDSRLLTFALVHLGYTAVKTYLDHDEAWQLEATFGPTFYLYGSHNSLPSLSDEFRKHLRESVKQYPAVMTRKDVHPRSVTDSDPYNLDVDAPDKVLDVLDHASRAFVESGHELDSAWQDTSSGKPWRIIAAALESAKVRIAKALEKL